MVAYRKRNYRRKSSMKKRAYKKKTIPRISFDKRVKTVISRMAENKTLNFRKSLNLLPYEATAWTDTITPLTPDTLFLNCVQGTGQGNRIGNSIRVKSLKLTGVLRPLPYNATTNVDPVPLYIKLMFLTRKDTPTEIFPAASDLLQYGNTSESPGNSGSLERMMRPINTDEWMVHTVRTFKLGYANYAGTSADINAQSHANNDFKLNHFVNIDLTKYCTKQIKFDDNTTNPSSRNVVMYPLVYTSNATDFVYAQSIPAKFDFSIDLVFEDL